MPFLFFLVWLVLEVWMTLHLAELFGAGTVMLWLLAAVVLGIIVIRRAGWSAVPRIQAALARNEAPAREMLDAMMQFLAGALLIVPGPLTDIAGLMLLIPAVRAPALRAADARVRRARPDLHEPIIIEGEFEDITPKPPPPGSDRRRLPGSDD